MTQTLHVFSGTFGSEEQARQYAEEQWERPAPDESWSEEEHEAWEERNPKWALLDDLRVVHMDSDFVETIFEEDRIEYLEAQLAADCDRQQLRAEIPEEADTLVLIMSDAFDGRAVRLASTPRLKYHGEFLWNVAG
jgi:hypothetical protein